MGPQDLVSILLWRFNSSRQWVSEQLRNINYQGIWVFESCHDLATNSLRCNYHICGSLSNVPSTQSPRPEKVCCSSNLRSPCAGWCSWHPRTAIRQSSRTFGMLLCKSFRVQSQIFYRLCLVDCILYGIVRHDLESHHGQHGRIDKANYSQCSLLHLVLRWKHHWAICLQDFGSTCLSVRNNRDLGCILRRDGHMHRVCSLLSCM